MYHQHIVSSTSLSHWEYVPKGRVGKSGSPTSPLFAPPAALQAQQGTQYSHQPSLCTNGHAQCVRRDPMVTSQVWFSATDTSQQPQTSLLVGGQAELHLCTAL